MAATQTLQETTRDSGDTRRLILRIAEELFTQHGYAAVTMNRIVEEVSKVRKLTKAGIYYYFEDKATLFVAVMVIRVEEHGRDIERATKVEGDLRTRVLAVAAAIQRGRPQNMPRMFSDLDDYVKEKMHGEFQALFLHSILTPLVGVFEDAAVRGELRPGISASEAALALFALVAGIDLAQRPPPDAPPMEIFKLNKDVLLLATDVLLNGIAAP